jgi:hypothetical protein
MSETGTLVGSGTFKVDRWRALEKLKDFQLPDPTKFLLPWVRCAVASGASYIKVRYDQGGESSLGRLTMQFDGRPFTARELEDPYGCLFEESSPDNARNRNLAIGILCVLRSDPGSVAVRSGAGAGRLHLRINALGNDSITKAHDRSTETIFGVTAAAFFSLRDSLEQVEKHYRLRTVPVVISRPDVWGMPSEETFPASELSFQSGAVYGRVEVPGNLSREKCVVRLHNYGVFVEAVEVEPSLLRVDCLLNDDQFTLNVSQTGVVRNERFDQTMQVIHSEGERLLLATIRQQVAGLAEASKLMSGKFMHRAWRHWLERGEDAELGGLFTLTQSLFEDMTYAVKWLYKLGDLPEWKEENAKKIWRAARMTAWLRETSARALRDLDKDSVNPTLKALWEAPLFLSVGGKPLSLSQLDALRRRLGNVPVSTEPCPGVQLPYEVVWCICEADRTALARHFPVHLQDVTTNLRSLAQGSHVQTSGGPTSPGIFERAGIFNLLIRDGFASGSFRGEAGLQMPPGVGGARLHVLRDGVPSDVVPIDCGLRFAAAMDFPAGLKESERHGAQTAALQAARALYAKLKLEYDHRTQSSRDAAIREHMLDFLSFVLKGGSPEAIHEQDRWILSLPLFQVAGGWWSYGNLRRNFAEGRIVYLALNPQVAQGLEGNLVLFGDSESLLARVLPGAAFLEISDKPGVQMMFMSVPKPACHHPASFGCLIERRRIAGDEPVCVAVGNEGPGPKQAFPWGTVRVYPRGATGPSDSALQSDSGWGLELATALVERRGTLFNQPGDPARRFLLQALGYYFAPWPGPAQTPMHKHLLELLGSLPMFRRSDGGAWTIRDTGLVLSSGLKLRYIPQGTTPSAHLDEFVLSEQEADLIGRLWPDRKDLLVTVHQAPAAVPGPEPSAIQPAPDKREPEAFVPTTVQPQAPLLAPPKEPEEQVTENPEGHRAETVPRPETQPPLVPASREPSVVRLAHQRLLRLCGRRGMKLPGEGIRSLRLGPSSAGDLLELGPTCWAINEAHQLAEAVLGSSLTDEQKALYLASLVYTAANRELSNVTDLDDVKFQQALADQLTEKPEEEAGV